MQNQACRSVSVLGTVLTVLSLPAAAAEGAAGAGNGGRSGWDVTLDGGVGVAPRYEGSNRAKVSPAGSADIVYDQGTFFAGNGGIGTTPVRLGNFRLATALGYNGGRLEKDDRAELHGLGNVKHSFLVGAAATYTLGFLEFGATAARGFTGAYGTTVDFSMGTEAPVTESLTLSGAVHAKWADDQHMRHFFGVTPLQAAASGKRAFDAGAGFQAVGFGLDGVYALCGGWALTGAMGSDWLIGDAGKSPVTQRRLQLSGRLGVRYSF